MSASPALTLAPLATAEGRAQYIRQRRLEIASTLAEWKRAYVVDGVSRPLAQRVELEAESAALALEAHQLKGAALAEKLQRQRALNAGLLNQLLALLQERGLDEIVAEATRRAESLQGCGFESREVVA